MGAGPKEEGSEMTLDVVNLTLIVANLGTILTVVVAVTKISSRFGALENQVVVNKENINKNEKRIAAAELRSM